MEMGKGNGDPSPEHEKYLYWTLVVVALLLGLLFGWTDSRPSWDDTLITGIAVFGLTALLGLTIPKRPWIWALLVGIWIPILNILFNNNFGSLLAIVIAFIGAYGGAFLHKTFFSE